MVDDRNLNETVYHILEGVLRGTTAPPGAKGHIFRVIDQLKAQHGTGEAVNLAERISLLLLRFEGTLRDANQAASENVRTEIRQLAALWIQLRISGITRPSVPRIGMHPLSTLGLA